MDGRHFFSSTANIHLFTQIKVSESLGKFNLLKHGLGDTAGVVLNM